MSVAVLHDWKAPPRIKDESARRRKLLADPWCRWCGCPATDPHHILFKSQGGDDVEDNILPACRGCHDLFHDLGFLPCDLAWEEVCYVFRKVGSGRAARILNRYGMEIPT